MKQKRSDWMAGLIRCDKIISEHGYTEANLAFIDMKVHILNTDYFCGFLDRLCYEKEVLNDIKQKSPA